MKRENIAPGLIVYTCLIQTCIKARQFGTAMEIFKEMKSGGIKGDDVTYNTLINGCMTGKQTQIDIVYELVLDSLKEGVQLS